SPFQVGVHDEGGQPRVLTGGKGRHSLLRPGEGVGGSACLPVELCDLKERPRRRKVAACYGHLGFYVAGFARQGLHAAGDGATLSRFSSTDRCACSASSMTAAAWPSLSSCSRLVSSSRIPLEYE